MRSHRLHVCLGLATAGLLVAGSGDSDDQLSASDFRARANAVCTAGGEEVHAAFFGALGEDATPEEMQAALDTVIALSRRQLDDIEALAAPSELADRVEAFVAQGRADTDVAAGMGLGFFESDDDPWTRTSELAADLGLEACAGG